MVATYTESVCPKKVRPRGDPAARLVQLATAYPQLASDTILHRGFRHNAADIVKQATDRLSQDFDAMSEGERMNAYETLIELAFNFVGVESHLAWFSEKERSKAFGRVATTLMEWEKRERSLGVSPPLSERVVDNMLREWKRVLGGKSMVAKIAEEIEAELKDEDNGITVLKFVQKVRSAITENVYYRIRERRMSKLGNDSATGLRFVRHLGFVQVSSNPVIAARAYEDLPELWNTFRKIVEQNPDWKRDPESYGDEIALHATITSLLPNVLVFRPIALLSGFGDGLVSYQLNPFGATNFRASVKDAENICAILGDILWIYDAWFQWLPSPAFRSPNIVFKVAACAPVARRITTGLNARGIGTNNTVTYSVSQELTLLMDAVRGMARALKRGIPVSQVYETNMIGRLEDHLRESEAERFFGALEESDLDMFGKKICGSIPQGTREEKIKALSAKKNLRSFKDEIFQTALRGHFSSRPGCGEEGEDYIAYLAEREEDIQCAGIYVTRRVYQLFFSFDAREKWMDYFKRIHNVSSRDIEEIINKVDLLPASKRRAQDTYLVLGVPGVTNTEFPDQQAKVFEASHGEDFDLEKFRESIGEEPDPLRLERLLTIPDFRKAYELTPVLKRTLRDVGVKDTYAGGTNGMKPAEWPSYGAVQKTMAEFENAYESFKKRVIDFVRS